MSKCETQIITTPSEDEDFLFAMEFNALGCVPMALKTTVEMGILDLLAESGDSAPLSSFEIATRLNLKNTEAPVIIDRVLRLLASYCVLSCTLVAQKDGTPQRVYGLGPRSKYFVSTSETFVAPLLLMLHDKIVMQGWSGTIFSTYRLEDAIREGRDPFELANGTSVFEYAGKHEQFNEIFNRAMKAPTNIYMKKIVEGYRGFDNAKTVVDVGGGLGASLKMILAKHPHIHGINFDLPHVVREAPPHPGIEHVGGNMLEFIPKADVIFMKWIIHGGNDKFCIKLLKNCWEALPAGGKVVIVDAVIAERPETDIVSRNTFLADMAVLNVSPGGIDRTEREFEVLASAAGFDKPKLACRAYNMWVVELYKKIQSGIGI